MALTWTTALRDLVSQQVVHKSYADLRTHEAAMLDAGTTGATPSGIAGHAMTYLRQFAQWYEQAGAGSSTGPDVWEHVYAAEVAYRFAIYAREPQYAQQFKQLLDRAWRSAVDSYLKDDANASTVTQIGTPTVKKFRFHIINALMRRRPPIYVPVAALDQCIYWAFHMLWNRGPWTFRRRQVKMTIALGGAVTLDLPSGETFGKINSVAFYYSDSEAAGGDVLRWAEADEYARALAASAASATATGRPLIFRTEQRVAGLEWLMVPTADKEYSARGEVVIATPAIWSDANDTVPFAKLPADFFPALADLSLAKVLTEYDAKDKDEYMRRALEQIDVLLPTYATPGYPEVGVLLPRDVYHDIDVGRRGGL